MVAVDFTTLAATITDVVFLFVAGAVAVLGVTLALRFGINGVRRYFKG
jgi:hypothetical protein